MRIQSITFIICLLLLTISTATEASGDCLGEPKLQVAMLGPGSNEVSLLFDNNTDFDGSHKARLAEARSPGSWFTVSTQILSEAKAAISSAQKAALLSEAMPDVGSVRQDGTRGLVLRFLTPLRLGAKYAINVTEGGGVIAKDCIGAAVEFELPTPKPSDAQPVPTPTGGPTKIVLNDVKKREDADIYIEGIAEGARGQKTAFTIDASFGKKFQFREQNVDNTWKPFFEIKASTNEKADPNALAFGVEFEQAKRTGSNPFDVSHVFFTETARFEADRDFKNVNLIGDFRTYFVADFLANEIDIVPFIGIEVGKNLRSPLEEVEGNGIARPVVGADLYFNFYKWEANAGEYQKSLSFETNYIRRWPLTREIALDDGDSGPLALRVSRVPRDYIKNSLTWDFAKNFGFKLNHEYGSLPPLFKLVDHKFSVGLVFKGALARKAR